MDFLDPKKRRAHRIKLFIGYGLVAIALTFATTIVLFQAYGFDIDPKTGDVIQNGLMFVDASPVEAQVLLNGENRGQTDLRLDVPADDYRLELQADGYRNWQREFYLEGGQIERITYPFLFPAKLITDDVQLYAQTPSLVSQSPDRRLLLALPPGSLTNFDLIDTSEDLPAAISISLPAGLLTNPTSSAGRIQVIEWSNNNRHVLLRHDYESGYEYLLLDTDTPGASLNLTRTLSLPAGSAVSLLDKRFDEYQIYGPAEKTLWRADLQNTQPAVYQTGVAAFKSYGDNVLLFVSDEAAAVGRAWLNIRENDETHHLREIAAGNNYLLDIAQYDGNWYAAGGTADDKQIYIYKDPVAQAKNRLTRLPVPVSVLRPSQVPEFLSFSENTRFIAVQSQNHFAVYDNEYDRQYRYDIQLPLPPGQRAVWMDGHRLSVVSDGKVFVWDFDSLNRQELAAAQADSRPYFDQSWQNLYTVAPSIDVPGRSALTVTPLLVTVE